MQIIFMKIIFSNRKKYNYRLTIDTKIKNGNYAAEKS